MKYSLFPMGCCDITVPGYWRTSPKSRVILKGGLAMAGFVQDIFFAPEGGVEMKSVQAATALENCGLKGDRYCAGTGHWSRFGRVCEVTFIAAEDLDDIERETGVGVKNGEHRRNVVTRGISLKALRRGERFCAGEVVFEYRGPRSVCRYIERLTELGMTQALKGRGGICARVVENGTVRVGDRIEMLQPTAERP
jgi:MOSC domain-containing protein YiiM